MMKTTKVLREVCGLSMLCIACGSPGEQALESIEPITAPFEMPVLMRPEFPDRLFDIREYGAVDTSAALNTIAFSKAIDACSRAGGGRVLVPSGIWLTGPIELKSNVNLHLPAGAELRFTMEKQYYFRNVGDNAAGRTADAGESVSEEIPRTVGLISAYDCSNIAITGAGTVNGQGLGWWSLQRKWWNNNEKHLDRTVYEQTWQGLDTTRTYERPRMIEPTNCRNVLFEGVTFLDGPSWMVHPVMCENVIIRRITVRASAPTPGGDTPNTDGINPESCKNVLIEYCDIETGDDSFAIKSGKDEEGRRRGRASDNIVIRHCRAARMAVGSEMSGGVRNVLVRDVQLTGSSSSMLHIKSRRGRGGVVENLWFEDIEARGTGPKTILVNMEYWTQVDPAPYEPVSERTPQFRNFHFRNINCGSAPVGIVIRGLPEMPVEQMTFEHIRIDSVHQGINMKHAQGLVFDHMTIAAERISPKNISQMFEGVLIDRTTAAEDHRIFTVLENCTDISMAHCEFQTADKKPAMIVRGNASGNIRLDETLSGTMLYFENGAQREAVRLMP